jgi:Copper type II ascorbate-dependent monooxygenase, C-terminal domain
MRGQDEVPIDPNAPTTTDRCLRPPCQLSHLPAQPQLAFLEDMGDGWKRMMEAEWELAAGTEGYRCMTLTLPEDVYVTGFAPQSPLGTHHATFGISAEASGPDTVVACGVGATGSRRLQGSGAGSEPSLLPAGVAMPLRKGEQIAMNLHLFNLTTTTLRGRSGMWIRTARAADVQVEAEAVLAGPLTLNIPSGRSTQRGGCTIRADATIYGVAPHMHQNGVHLRASVKRAEGELVVYDGNYDFNHQLFHDIPDMQLKMGDVVNVECTYQNESGKTINWGDSSLDEMCFLGLGLYPAIGYGGLPCFN